MLQEAALVFGSTKAFTNQFAFEGHSLPDAEAVEVFGESRLTLLIDHEDEVDIIGFKIHF